MHRKKVCTKCGRYLWLHDYYKMSNRKDFPDGYDCRCKECRRAEKRESYAKSKKIPDGLKINADGILVEKNGQSSRIYWSDQKKREFAAAFPYNTNEDLSIDFEVSVRTIVRRAREMGLEKSPGWLQDVWDKNRTKAHRVNKYCGNKADLTNFKKAGEAHRFKAGEVWGTSEERSDRMRRAWITRKRNKYGKLNKTRNYEREKEQQHAGV